MSAPPRRKASLFSLVLATGIVALLAVGCTKPGGPPPDPETYKERTSPANVVNNVIVSYKKREIDRYAELLADDFQFYFDEETRPVGIPIFWNRLEDSTGTGNLFSASDVTDIRITLTYGNDVPVTQVGRESWRKITVTDTFLEVDKPPVGGGEVLTLRVDGDLQDFYFRKGKAPGDTLPGSTTANLWYLVEWRDQGRTQ